jgi:hypothetical protein
MGRTRVKREAEALVDKRLRRNKRSSMDKARLAGGGQQRQEKISTLTEMGGRQSKNHFEGSAKGGVK